MISGIVLLTLIAAAGASPFPQGVTDAVSPDGTAPSGCEKSYDGTFGFYIETLSASAPTATASAKKRSLIQGAAVPLEPRTPSRVLEARADASSTPVACDTPTTLSMTLEDGVLKDSQGRIGYIASNRQFQFDGPPQAGAIYTAGFSVCDDGAIALGGSKTWYQCNSGDFYNLYDQDWAPQCEPVEMKVVKLYDCAAVVDLIAEIEREHGGG